MDKEKPADQRQTSQQGSAAAKDDPPREDETKARAQEEAPIPAPRDVTEVQAHPPFEEERGAVFQRTIVKTPGAAAPWEGFDTKAPSGAMGQSRGEPPKSPSLFRRLKMGGPGQALPWLPRLVSLSPALQLDVTLRKPITHIGRAPENDIVIDHDSISRCHARIESKTDGYHVTDLDSKNGVLVDDEPVRSARLKHECTVEIGLMRFRFLHPREEALAKNPRSRKRLRIALWLLILALAMLAFVAYI